MNYSETKQKIDNIREEYGCKGEIIFRSAIQYVVECGQQIFQDPIWVKQQLDNIDVNHDEAEKEGKMLFITRDFEKAVLECARELARSDVYDLLTYIQKEVWFGDNDISYKRAIHIIQNCINGIISGVVLPEAYGELLASGVDIERNELEELGYGYILDAIEEDY